MFQDPRNQNQKTQDNRNLIIALVICSLIFIGSDYYMRKHYPQQPAVQENVDSSAQTSHEPEMVTMKKSFIEPHPIRPEKVERVALDSDVFESEVALKGGRLDKLTLPQFEIEKGQGEKVHLFAPNGENMHFFDAGWQSAGLLVPNAETVWQKIPSTDSHRAEMVWKNETGQTFKRTFITKPHSYAIQVIDEVQNNAGTPIALGHYAQIHKAWHKSSGVGGLYHPDQSTWINFIGPQMYVNEVKVERDYDELEEKSERDVATQGWAGFTTRYFASAIIPEQQDEKTFRLTHRKVGEDDGFYSAIVQSPNYTLAPGQSFNLKYTVYAGPKSRDETESLGVNLEEMVDYGWFHGISLMMYTLLITFYSWFGNVGVAILCVTLVLRLILYPLTQKGYVTMAKMKKLQPRIEQLKQNYGEDRQTMTMEMMKLYQTHKLNPMSGCWPMLVQIPIFYAFYKMILISFPVRHAEFVGWIHDLSSQDPYYVLPLLMGLSMFIQQKIQPPATDPIQQKVMQFLPIIFTVMFAFFPAGLVLYWTTNNILSISQQYIVNKKIARMGLK